MSMTMHDASSDSVWWCVWSVSCSIAWFVLQVHTENQIGMCVARNI